MSSDYQRRLLGQLICQWPQIMSTVQSRAEGHRRYLSITRRVGPTGARTHRRNSTTLLDGENASCSCATHARRISANQKSHYRIKLMKSLGYSDLPFPTVRHFASNQPADADACTADNTAPTSFFPLALFFFPLSKLLYSDIYITHAYVCWVKCVSPEPHPVFSPFPFCQWLRAAAGSIKRPGRPSR